MISLLISVKICQIITAILLTSNLWKQSVMMMKKYSVNHFFFIFPSLITFEENIYMSKLQYVVIRFARCYYINTTTIYGDKQPR